MLRFARNDSIGSANLADEIKGCIKYSAKDDNISGGRMSETSGQHRRVEVRAPMSGIFYRKPTPDDPPYVEVGATVKKKQILALLETMKVFQKVKSPASGKIVEIIPQNESALKDNDLMFIIEENR